jgi:hypothetical protein
MDFLLISFWMYYWMYPIRYSFSHFHIQFTSRQLIHALRPQCRSILSFCYMQGKRYTAVRKTFLHCSNAQVRYLPTHPTPPSATQLENFGPAFPSCSPALAVASLPSPVRLHTCHLPTQLRSPFLNARASRLDPCVSPAPLPESPRQPARPDRMPAHFGPSRSHLPLPRTACLRTSTCPLNARSSSPRPPFPHAHAPPSWPIPQASFSFVAPPA